MTNAAVEESVSRPASPAKSGITDEDAIDFYHTGSVVIAGIGLVVFVLIAGGFFLFRSAPFRASAPAPATIHLEPHGRSPPMAFTAGEQVRWSYPACAPPSPACVDLVATGQDRFTLGGSPTISDGRATGHYTFHHAMTGQFRSSAAEAVDVQLTLNRQ